MDRIELRALRAYGRHGANPGERDIPQAFDLDLELQVDLTIARTSDDLADTIDYDALARRARAIVSSTSFALLERLAGEIATEVMRDARIIRAAVRVAKPRLLDGATPAVTVHIERE